MDYSNFLMMKEELSLIAVIVVLLLYDLCASKKALRYFQPVACVLVGVHTPSPADHSTIQKRGIFAEFMATE